MAKYLSTQVADYQPFSTCDVSLLKQILQPGDILLVEGDTRVSGVIKYLTQSIWSHSALYVGEHDRIPKQDGESCVLIEAELGFGVIAVPLSKYKDFNVRICRPVGLTDKDRDALVNTMIENVGMHYDLKHIFDLARYLVPTPPIPVRFRRRMIALGSGDPSRAICSSLIAETFQSIRYPILPRIEKHHGDSGSNFRVKEIYHIRHHTLFTPSDFDVSPFFQIVKPTLEKDFDYKSLVFKENKDHESAA